MAILYGFAALCLFGVVFLHKAKQGRWLCAVVTYKFPPRQRTAHWFTMKAPNPLGMVSLLSLPLVMGIAMCLLWEIFLKNFGSGQSDVHSGNSITCCVVNADILNTLIKLYSSKRRSHAISRLSEDRKIHVLSYRLTTRFPWVHVRVHHATRSHRVSWAQVRLSELKTFKTISHKKNTSQYPWLG